jgi:hypothetical protein
MRTVVREVDEQLAPCALRDVAQVGLGAAAHGNSAGLDEVLERVVVDALGGQDDVGAGLEDHLDALLGDVVLAADI